MPGKPIAARTCRPGLSASVRQGRRFIQRRKPGCSASCPSSPSVTQRTASTSGLPGAAKGRSTVAWTVWNSQPPPQSTVSVPVTTESGIGPISSIVSRYAPARGDSPARSAPPGMLHVPPSWTQAARSTTRWTVSPCPGARAERKSPAAPSAPQCRWASAQTVQHSAGSGRAGPAGVGSWCPCGGPGVSAALPLRRALAARAGG